MVFDKEAMAKNLYQGNAEPTAQVFRKGTAAYIEGMEDPYPFDVEKAKALMEEAGYADGFDLELPTMEGQNFETLMPYVTEQLAQINIRVKQVPLSGCQRHRRPAEWQVPGRAVAAGQPRQLGAADLRRVHPEGWWNLQHQPDEYVDSRWAQIATATPEESAQLQKEINQYLVDQAWFAPMVYMGTNFAYDAGQGRHPDRVRPGSADPQASRLPVSPAATLLTRRPQPCGSHWLKTSSAPWRSCSWSPSRPSA